MTASDTVVDMERDGPIAVLTLQRMARRNAMDQALVDGVKAHLLALDRDDSVHAIVLTGSNPGFCAGSDLKFISGLDMQEMARFEQECGDLGRLIGFNSKPVVAAVEGFAIGGGFTLATCCDVVVAATGSRWSLPEVPHGWLTPWGLKSLVARVGHHKARLLCYCLEAFDGVEAKAMGVADYTAGDGEALARARAIAHQLATLPRPAVAATKRFFSNYLMQDAETMDFESNRLFVANCLETSAQATLAKFRGPGRAA